MGDTLERLDHLITETLKPDNLKASPLRGHQIEELIIFATGEEKAIKKKIQTGYVNATTHQTYSHKLYAYQRWIITLSNTLSKYFHNYKVYTHLYDHCFVILDDLTIFLEEFFPRYFDYDQQVSEEKKLVVVQNIKCRISNLETLAKRHEIDKELVNIISETLREYYYNSKDHVITFKLVAYFDSLFRIIYEAIEYGPIEDKTLALISALHTANFNHTRFFTYLTRCISIDTSSTARKDLQIEKLYSFKMNLEQTPLGNPKVMLFPGMESAKELLANWINELLSVLDRSHQGLLIMPPGISKQPQLVEVNLSVAQLSYGLKVMIDTDTIINISHKQLSEITASGCKTFSTAKISSESLRTKSNANPVTKMKVKEVLIKMLNYVNQSA